MSELKFNIQEYKKPPNTYSIRFSRNEIKEILEKHMKDNGLVIPDSSPEVLGLETKIDHGNGNIKPGYIKLVYKVYE